MLHLIGTACDQYTRWVWNASWYQNSHRRDKWLRYWHQSVLGLDLGGGNSKLYGTQYLGLLAILSNYLLILCLTKLSMLIYQILKILSDIFVVSVIAHIHKYTFNKAPVHAYTNNENQKMDRSILTAWEWFQENIKSNFKSKSFHLLHIKIYSDKSYTAYYCI